MHRYKGKAPTQSSDQSIRDAVLTNYVARICKKDNYKLFYEVTHLAELTQIFHFKRRDIDGDVCVLFSAFPHQIDGLRAHVPPKYELIIAELPHPSVVEAAAASTSADVHGI
ncbi:hypothetical protein BG015_007570 [Linnemannia schmuckeri]|uniref:Uncharacterized protein n=1 Tax=Linnemannia schmuckeri TaxID=64567 RepID=A0A9P5SA48_9FUNG|nr:hypothetical protein BG015_007570 [Linnemannia schmuckeri]